MAAEMYGSNLLTHSAMMRPTVAPELAGYEGKVVEPGVAAAGYQNV